MAQHTLNDEEYQGLLTARRDAEERAAKLKAELVCAKQEDPANRIRSLNVLARAQLTIMRFAVANLTPETTRGWPTAALSMIADLIPMMPDASSDDFDLANELRSFVRDCEAYALVRAQMREDKLKADAEAPRGDLNGPKIDTTISTKPIGSEI